MGLLLQKLELEQQLERRDAYIANLEIAAAKNASLPEPKLEWVLMSDTPPHGDDDHIDCYIVLKRNKRNKRDVYERPWNTRHKCFDNMDHDDFEYNADDVFCWMVKPHVDLPPIPSEGE